jgi:hypothetical protein
MLPFSGLRLLQFAAVYSACTVLHCGRPSAERTDVPPRPPDSVLFREVPKNVTVEALLYDSVSFGALGHRILRERSPSDMQMLRQCLTYDDASRVIVVGQNLDLRPCDYALMVAEKLLGGDDGPIYRHTFGPTTPYEFRDDARELAARRLFDDSIRIKRAKYTYLDENGRDVSEM